MALSLEKVYYTAMRKYGIKLLAGTSGIWNTISWIHTVEDIQVVDFLKGQELVITTGIKNPTEQELIEFTKSVYAAKASGLIFNIGPFIASIPKEIIRFASDNNFPVFTLPWEVRLVEFNREFCNLIIQSEQESQNLCSAFKNAIFSPSETELYLPVLQQEGILMDEKYCMVKCMPQITGAEADGYDYTKILYDLRLHCERIMNRTQKKFVIFRHESYLTIVIPATNKKQVQGIIEEILSFWKWKHPSDKIYFAVSKYDLAIDRLAEYFEILSIICKMGRKEERTIWYWEDLGILALILSVRDMEQLVDYGNNTIGVLEKYDRENNTNYCKILSKYLELNGNMLKVAEECFVHRNTVSYYLKKISEMLRCDLYSTKDRVELYIAFCIRDVMQL